MELLCLPMSTALILKWSQVYLYSAFFTVHIVSKQLYRLDYFIVIYIFTVTHLMEQDFCHTSHTVHKVIT